jgi:hypothetical protein
MVPRKQGGRVLMHLEEDYAVEITKLAKYVDRKEDQLLQTVRKNQYNINSAVLQLDASRLKYREEQEK